MGATGGGLSLLGRRDPLAQSTFQHFGTAEGLLSNTVQAIQEDLSGYIWVSTESGISRLDPEQKRFENLITSSGAHMTTFNEMASWRQADGTLLYGGYDGLYILDPNEVRLDSPNPPVIITGIQVDGNAMAPGVPGSPLTESITTTRQLTLRHDQNSINLECVLMNYREPELNQYAYYLEGYEPDYNPSSLRNVATYRNLPPGRYTFHIKGCNSLRRVEPGAHLARHTHTTPMVALVVGLYALRSAGRAGRYRGRACIGSHGTLAHGRGGGATNDGV